MIDTLAVKPITTVTLGATAINFARVKSESTASIRRATSPVFGALDTVDIRIEHQPIGRKRNKQRSLLSVDVTHVRVDADDQPTGVIDTQNYAVQFSRTVGVSSSENLTALNYLIGLLMETRDSETAAVAKGMYRTEE